MRRKGFTLIELLVVIAIIAILAAILFPVFARVREKARQSACTSNLKQLATAMLMYVQDYDERFPGSYCCLASGFGYWHQLIMPYVNNEDLFTCPSEPGRVYNGAYPGGYGYNGYGTTASNGLGWRIKYSSQWAPIIAKIKQPSMMVMLGEPHPYYFDLRGYGAAGTEYAPALRHNGGSNIAHVDGHVKWYQGDAIAAGADRAAGWTDKNDPQWVYWVRDPESSDGR
jgi:prepilin-type N-terminal cleavage/methylation domain-containing protein/prepilin-type processing-associated H-X9-DG protein